MSNWIEDTHGLIKLPTPSGAGGYGVDRKANINLGGEFRAQAHGPAQISGLAIGLGAVAQAADKWAGVLAQVHHDRQEIALNQDVQDFRRLSDQFISQFTANNQGQAGIDAVLAYDQWFAENFKGLKKKWEGRGLVAEKYLETHLGAIGTSGLDYMGRFGLQQQNEWRVSTAVGGLELALQDARHNPKDYLSIMTPALDTLAEAMRHQGKSEEEIEAKLGELRRGGLKEAALALGEIGEHEAALKLLQGQADGGIGRLSARYESRAAGSRAIGYDSKGGTSYGTYQIAAKPGTFGAWLTWLKQNGHGDVAEELSVGAADTGSRNGAVPTAWRRLVGEGRITREMEHAFIKASHYDPAINGLDDDLRQMVENTPALQDVVWSTAVQHGAAGGKNILNRAYQKGMAPEDFVRVVYAERTKSFIGNPYAKEAARRFKAEGRDALNMLAGGVGDLPPAERQEVLGKLEEMEKKRFVKNFLNDNAQRLVEGEDKEVQAELDDRLERGEINGETHKAATQAIHYQGQSRKQAQDDALVKTLGVGLAEAFQGGDEIEIAERIKQGHDEIAKEEDPDRRNRLESAFQREINFQQTRREAADMVAAEKFLALATEQSWLPSQMLEALDKVEGLSRSAKAKMAKQITEGTLNNPNAANRAATDQLMAEIDLRRRAGDPMTSEEIEAYAQRGGLTVEQINATRKYNAEGGLAGHSGLAGKVSDLFKELTGGDLKAAPPGFLEMVANSLPPGKPATPDELRKTVASLLLSSLSGESKGGGWGYGRDETYAEAVKAGRAGTWRPDVSKDESKVLDYDLRAAGLKVTEANRRLWKKGQWLSLPLSDEERRELLGK